MRSSHLRLAVLAILFCMFAHVAEAGEGAPDAAKSAGASFWVWALGFVAYLTRKSPIGGWLMLFVIQAYSGTLVGLAAALTTFRDLSPDLWPSGAAFLAYAAVTVISAVWVVSLSFAVTLLLLRRYRTWRSLVLFRRFLIVGVVIALLPFLASGVDPSSLTLEPAAFIAVIQLICWTIYFYRSKRIRHVFFAKDWDWYSQSKYGYRGGGLPYYLDYPQKLPLSATCIRCGVGTLLDESKVATGIFTCHSCNALNLFHSSVIEYATTCSRCETDVTLDRPDIENSMYSCPACGAAHLVRARDIRIREKPVPPDATSSEQRYS